MGLTAALGLLLAGLVQQIGASIAFMIGTIVLLIGGTILYSTAPQRAHPGMGRMVSSSIPLAKSRHYSLRILLFAVGSGAAFETNVLLEIFPAVLQQALPQLHLVAIASSILGIAALSANPLSRLVVKWGEAKAMQMVLTAVLGLIGLTVFSPNNAIFALIWLVALGIAFGLVFTDTIPYALSILPSQQAGLATGLYFGGGSAATVFFALLQQQTGGLTATQGLGGAAIACILANFCLLRSVQMRQKAPAISEGSNRNSI
ncbi:MAG: multidrug effflux MFS transporter [Acaryochloris sp. RU_4_1]|nr:multidrug effflux MFS transporter [Acaryochloris sp. RU_4_1]NJR54680.1 multidrug effflux MFS transporter [Acaryochloris sp. CRU_2_0]